ncbi:MAG: hypothetical protein JNK05_38320 [Myxococcales bacterium]|nr:hypothetical protein [Myxococcales bacterium]
MSSRMLSVAAAILIVCASSSASADNPTDAGAPSTPRASSSGSNGAPKPPTHSNPACAHGERVYYDRVASLYRACGVPPSTEPANRDPRVPQRAPPRGACRAGDAVYVDATGLYRPCPTAGAGGRATSRSRRR